MKLAIKFTLLVTILTSVTLASTTHIERVFQILKTKNCYRIDFVQINNFLGKKEVYRGTLIRTPKVVEIVYKTHPPFVVKTEKEYVLLGYKGERPRVYKKNRIPNPILSLLLNLDRLDSFFNLKGCKGDNCTLIPKGYLRRNIKLVKVSIGPRFVKEIFLKGKGRDNTVRIRIKDFSIKSCKGGDL